MLFDLHTHSFYSDGDRSPAELIHHAQARGLAGLALTDHNTLAGLTGQDSVIAGVEISTLWHGQPVHILGYGRAWDAAALQVALGDTRQGYKQRIAQMVTLCHQAGYNQVSLADIAARRAGQANPAFISFDVAKELMVKHRLSLAQARAVTSERGVCYVPYGDWAMSPPAATELLHQVGGLAILAHPGITALEQGPEIMWKLIEELREALDGLEVYHHTHDQPLQAELAAFCRRNNLLVTGGSDYHGPDRYDFLGQIGLPAEDWEKFKRALG